MLQAKTEEQKSHIEMLLDEHGDGDIMCYEDGILFRVDSVFDIDIDFDQMAEIVDYLRKQNKSEK